MSNITLFTSESVSEGHPDKVADLISDSVLDAILSQDKYARVACETLVKDNTVVLAGEITTTAEIDYESVVRQAILSTGYDSDELGFNGNTANIIKLIGQQSPDIAKGVNEDEGLHLDQGAGDQGIMFGYAVNETSSYLPITLHYSHALMKRQSELRRQGLLRPDAKAQVTFKYEDGVPTTIAAIVLSTQHNQYMTHSDVRELVMEEIIKKVIPSNYINDGTKIFINPTGTFIIGGPVGDCGLTGRKIVVDAYGGACPVGGGAFSGKDPSKVDRSAAYAARQVAKSIVASGMSDRALVQVSYAIGIADPTSIVVETSGTNKVSMDEIREFVGKFDLRPKAIIHNLNLLRPIYRKTTNYGHFGRFDSDLTWESVVL